MEGEAVAPAVRSVAERAIALAATGGWTAADRQGIVASLSALGPADAGPHTVEIGDDERAHATIFPLRSGAIIPLHDHLDMTVICKVLHGRMRVESFEWADRREGLA